MPHIPTLLSMQQVGRQHKLSAVKRSLDRVAPNASHLFRWSFLWFQSTGGDHQHQQVTVMVEKRVFMMITEMRLMLI